MMMISLIVSVVFLVVPAVHGSYDLDYFDQLRSNSSLVQSYSQSRSNPERLWEVTDVYGETFQLAQIVAFLPFTDGTSSREIEVDGLAATLLAIHHFNNPELSPHLTPEDLKGCNIKLTAEFDDTRYSPSHSTGRLTKILQRANILEEPQPAGVIGAYRSAVTAPIAILTGVNDIPQISYASTSTDFDDKDQYPRFGRTCHSSTGEAQTALQMFESLGATHVGVLFVTDAFGSALQKAFQDAASEANIVTDSVAFSFAVDLDGTEIPHALKSLKKTQFRFFFVIAFEVHYNAIMEAALEQGLIGDEFLWIFVGFGPAAFQRNAAYEPGSALALASRGVGLISTQGSVRTEIIFPGDRNDPPPVEENATSSSEKFRTVWRHTVQEEYFQSYLSSRLPSDLGEDSGNDADYRIRLEATFYTPFLYDAVTSLGLAYCRAATNESGLVDQQFGGEQVYDQFRFLNFDGATGNVKIIPETGTRDYLTETFVLYNVQASQTLNEVGKAVFDLVPTNIFKYGWNTVKGRSFVYASGSTDTPQSLPEPKMEMNFVGSVGRAVGYTLMSVVIAGALAAFIWLIWFKNERVVRSSQPIFLSMVALGSLVMASSIAPLSLEGPVSETVLNSGCMAVPWLYMSGTVIAFSALLAKTLGVRRAYLNPDLDFIHVTNSDIFSSFAILYLLNFVIMITWQLVAPLEWHRDFGDSTDIFDRPVESFGTCNNEHSLVFRAVLGIFNITAMVVANWWAYQARNIETEYHESRYIGIAMASILQAWCMGVPILVVVWDNPQAKYFVQTGIIFLTASVVLLLIFVPKVLAVHSDRRGSAEEIKRKAYLNFTARTRQKDKYEQDEDNMKSMSDSYGKNEIELPDSDKAGRPSRDMDSSDEIKSSSESRDASPPVERPSRTQIASSKSRSLRNLRAGSITKAIRLSSTMHSDESSGELSCGLRVTHNPRSQRTLELSGGREISRRQLEFFDGDKNYDASDTINMNVGKGVNVDELSDDKIGPRH